MTLAQEIDLWWNQYVREHLPRLRASVRQMLELGIDPQNIKDHFGSAKFHLTGVAVDYIVDEWVAQHDGRDERPGVSD